MHLYCLFSCTVEVKQMQQAIFFFLLCTEYCYRQTTNDTPIVERQLLMHQKHINYKTWLNILLNNFLWKEQPAEPYYYFNINKDVWIDYVYVRSHCLT